MTQWVQRLLLALVVSGALLGPAAVVWGSTGPSAGVDIPAVEQAGSTFDTILKKWVFKFGGYGLMGGGLVTLGMGHWAGGGVTTAGGAGLAFVPGIVDGAQTAAAATLWGPRLPATPLYQGLLASLSDPVFLVALALSLGVLMAARARGARQLHAV